MQNPTTVLAEVIVRSVWVCRRRLRRLPERYRTEFQNAAFVALMV